MSNDLKCFFGLHKYEVYKEEDVIKNSITSNVNNSTESTVVGKCIIQRCSNCGNIKHIFIPTDADYIRDRYA